MKLFQRDLGKVVAVTVLDHVENGQNLATCMVYGRLVEFTPTMLLVRAWEEIGGDDHTDFAIVCGAVLAIEIMGEAE